MTKNFTVLYKTVIILLAILATLLLSSVILLILGADVFRTFYTIVITPLTRVGHITEVFVRAVPLCITALGVAVAYRSGIVNIGAEGQMAMGILGFTTVALALPDLPKPLLLPMVYGDSFPEYSRQGCRCLSCCRLSCSTTLPLSSIPSVSAFLCLIPQKHSQAQERRSLQGLLQTLKSDA